MAKKPVSVPLSRSQKKKATKHIGERRKLKSALRKIFNYMKSDSYMFAPLIHLQSSPPISSGGAPFEPMKEKEKKLFDDVDDYLKCNTYMYAPLIEDSISHGIGDQVRGNVCDQMEKRSEGTAGDDEHTLISSTDVDRHNPIRQIVVEKILLQKERVKHIAHQNCGSLSAAGRVLSEKEPHRILVE